MTATPLAAIGPVDQLRAGRLPRRLTQLLVGLTLFGSSMAMMIRGALGQMPWDVLHYGLATHLPLSFGQVVIAASAVVLLAWIPLRQAPGVGTVANAVVIGLATDATLAVLAVPDRLLGRAGLMAGGIALNALAGALYIGAQLGPGPRDGLMTGLARRTGRSIRVVRTTIELTVVALGVLLGGVLGPGTLLYAVSIGPLTQALLPWATVPLRDLRPRAASTSATNSDGSSPTSGCHCTPTQNGSPASSTASTRPSAAQAVSTSPAPRVSMP
jgi:uncharacterized membrane protein YczE